MVALLHLFATWWSLSYKLIVRECICFLHPSSWLEHFLQCTTSFTSLGALPMRQSLQKWASVVHVHWLAYHLYQNELFILLQNLLGQWSHKKFAVNLTPLSLSKSSHCHDSSMHSLGNLGPAVLCCHCQYCTVLNEAIIHVPVVERLCCRLNVIHSHFCGPRWQSHHGNHISLPVMLFAWTLQNPFATWFVLSHH
jgi:hypothetical protein